jgi:hypothetical protein
MLESDAYVSNVLIGEQLKYFHLHLAICNCLIRSKSYLKTAVSDPYLQFIFSYARQALRSHCRACS